MTPLFASTERRWVEALQQLQLDDLSSARVVENHLTSGGIGD
jgi:hypothetical protein